MNMNSTLVSILYTALIYYVIIEEHENNIIISYIEEHYKLYRIEL